MTVPSPTVGARMRRAWNRFSRSLLYVPTLMTIGAVALFAVTSLIDESLGRELRQNAGDVAGSANFLIFGGTATAATSVLSTVAGTWATIAGVVYSITLVTLQLSATKYSAQVIPKFERDRLNQVVLGAFAGTVAYSLLVLKTVRHPAEDGAGAEGFVPVVGVNLSVIFAIATLFLFIAFIGNLTSYIRPTQFVEGVTDDALDALDRTREPHGLEGYTALDPPHFPAGEATHGDAVPILSADAGYVTRVDWEDVAEAVTSRNGGSDGVPRRIRVLVRDGSGVDPGDRVAEVEGPGASDEHLASAILGAVRTARVRDVKDDPEYAIQSLGDVGVTALSSGSTDVGIAKAALRGLARIASEDLARPPPQDAFLLRVGEHDVEVRRVALRAHRVAFVHAKRILDRARAEGYWDVTEEFVGDVDDIVERAAVSDDDAAWGETLEWLRPILDQAVTLSDAHAAGRAVESVHAARRALARAGRRAEADELAFLLDDVASAHELPPPVRAAL